MTSYRVISAADWGGTWSRPPQYEKPLDPYGVLHHTAGSPYSSMTAEQAFHRLNESVKSGKGYSFLDYDMLCHYEKARDLVTIGWGRGKWMSAATRNFNEQGEAVCWLGYFHPGSRWSETVQPYHIEGAARAFYELHKAKLIAPNATLIGHRSNPAHPNATACPGNYWYPNPFDQMVGRFFQLRDGSTPPPPPPPSGYNPPKDWGLYPLDDNKPARSKGSSGQHVAYAQDVIFFYAGGNISRDGQFGTQTEGRVKDLQRFFGLTVDGKIGPAETWPVLDGLVAANIEAPPPPPPPPVSSVTAVNPVKYWVRPGDSPWAAAERIYGSGAENRRLDASQFNEPNHWMNAPGVAGFTTKLKSGEGPYSVLERMGLSDSMLNRYYDFNGGKDRALSLPPNSVVYCPKT